MFEALRYPLGILHEDEAVIHEIIGSAAGVAWVDEAHYFYRESPNSITTSRFTLKRLDETIAKEKRIAYFEARGMQNLADRTKIIYLNNLMRLYRTVQAELDDREVVQDTCRMLYHRFCELCTPELIRDQSHKAKLRYCLFRSAPGLFSRMDHARLKRREII
jgi:hypothetical protein